MRLTDAEFRSSMQESLQQITNTGLRRVRREVVAAHGTTISIDDCEATNFCSNDYLGLSHHPEVLKSLQQGLDRYGLGAGASPLVSGYSSAHRALEEMAAEFTRRERAIIFSSGYLANIAIVNAFSGRTALIAGDRLNHASLIDAARLSDAKFKRYAHAQPAALEKILRDTPARERIVVTDAVFSMDGDIAPLPEIAEVCAGAGAWLMVDDAHGFGVMGMRGAGTLEHFGLDSHQVPVLMATFGKAAGVCGAFVAGDEDVIEYLLQHARPYIYSTANPPALAQATLRALQLIAEESWRREHLDALIGYYREQARKLGLPVMESMTPIQPLILGAADKAVKMSQALFRRGFYVAAIRPPTVPQNTSRLRVTLTAGHSKAQIDGLLQTLSNLLQTE